MWEDLEERVILGRATGMIGQERCLTLFAVVVTRIAKYPSDHRVVSQFSAEIVFLKKEVAESLADRLASEVLDVTYPVKAVVSMTELPCAQALLREVTMSPAQMKLSAS